MQKNASRRILWGLVFVLFDIRFNSIDLILPDFIGYILIAQGLREFVTAQRAFRKARYLAILMIFLSLPNLVDWQIDLGERRLFKGNLRSFLTGDLSALLPRQIDSMTLVSTATESELIDRGRTANPTKDKDHVLGEYSDGTTVLILRYPSSEEALAAMQAKYEEDYGEGYFGQGVAIQGGKSTSGDGDTIFTRRATRETNERAVSLWWNRGWDWWNPWSWTRPGGGWCKRNLTIIEGTPDSVATFQAFRQNQDKPGAIRVTIHPLFPILLIGGIIHLLLIWHLCSGILALATSSGKERLAKLAKRRRRLYLTVTIIGWVFSVLLFIAPRFDTIQPRTFVSFTIRDIIQFIVLLLIIGLMRKSLPLLDSSDVSQPVPIENRS